MTRKTIICVAVVIISILAIIISTGIVSARIAYYYGYEIGYNEADSRVDWNHWGENSDCKWVEVVK